jgi:hypothetical protein
MTRFAFIHLVSGMDILDLIPLYADHRPVFVYNNIITLHL